MSDPNRQIRITRLGEEGPEVVVAAMSVSERVQMVWQLTVQTWLFKDGVWNEPRLRRDVSCVIRSESRLSDRRGARDGGSWGAEGDG